MRQRIYFDKQYAKAIVYQIPVKYFQSETTMFADLQAAGGQFIYWIVERLREFGHSDENIKQRVFSFSEKQTYLNILKHRNKSMPVQYNLYSKDLDMEFDVIVGNPPYKNGMHISFLNKAFNLLSDGGLLTIVHPSQPFLNNKPCSKKNSEKQLINIVNSNSTTIELINGNSAFENIKIFVPLSITTIIKDGNSQSIKVFNNHIESNKKIETLTNIYQLHMHGDNEIVNSIKNKLISKLGSSVQDVMSNEPTNKDSWFVTFNILGGNVHEDSLIAPDFYCPIYKKYENDYSSILTNTHSGRRTTIGFNDFDNAKLFVDYLKTKFVRFCISLCKVNQHFDNGEMSYVPFFNGNPPKEKDIYKFFGFSKNEIDFINNYIPNWYDIDFK